MLPNIPTDQQENYSNAFEVLMDSYGVTEEHRVELEELLYYFVVKFESSHHILYEHEQAVNALTFFREIISVKNITTNEFKRKNENASNTYNPLTEYLTVQICGKFQKAKALLDYYNIGLDTMDFLYNKIRLNDPLLSSYLKEHPTLPSIDILNSFIEEIELKAQNTFLEDIRDIAKDLNQYLSKYLPIVVSRHKYHLIFDLLYLCDVFKYIRIINKHKGSYYSIESNITDESNITKVNKYLIPSKIKESEKYKVISGIFKNESRSELYKNEVRKRFREK